ncbi:MAG TPA: serine hydrolase [Ochrobactrum intermedium]|uniref:Serine hydrolase n=1 Tax=Brucella intermedia TaxID=94625 RepID=A0A7V6PDJ5_9HYPH|nr:serine hydrolase [Brucella intermedia]HHV68986.1 serine hydrolase [Brucella intermedia]
MKKKLAPFLVAQLAFASVAAASDLKQTLAASDIQTTVSTFTLVENTAFVPPSEAAAPISPFNGTLTFSESKLLTEPAKFKSEKVGGKFTQVFPAISIAFVSDGENLIPATQDIIRNGSLEPGTSYWDVIVQPGKIWSEVSDNGWSRASFPFSLVHSFEGETHNGVAIFLYKGDKVSSVRYQITQQTAPFLVEDYFTAGGTLNASFDGSGVSDARSIVDRFRQSEQSKFKIADWSELAKRNPGIAVDNFDSDIARGELVADGLRIDDTFYLKSCKTVAGPLPYCDRQRFGVWSVTKSAGVGVAMLRLAEKYEPDILEQKISDYVTEAKGVAGWQDVTFGDAFSMSTGMGYGSEDPKHGISDPFDGPYTPWYSARTAAEKIRLMLRDGKRYPWKPGEVARYRDEDMFLLGVALDRYVKTKEGASADLWTFINREVYEPLGIYYAPINATIEADPKADQPLMFQGLYATFSDLMKIAKLYQDGGRIGNKQVLNAMLLHDILPSEAEFGLSTGVARTPFYSRSFWRAKFEGKKCSFYFPSMQGWGKNFVMLLPNDMTVLRLAKTLDGNDAASNLDSMTAVANSIRPLCP